MLQCRSVFISDVHLGFDGCSAESLVSFLRSVDARTLYLVGDIIDLACASSALMWPAAHHQVLREIFSLADAGRRVVYIPGNHDALLRDLCGVRFGSVEIHSHAIHETADGRKLLVLHGDEFEQRGDGDASPWLDALGGRAYGMLLGVERQLNALAAPFGMRGLSVAGTLKQVAKSAVTQRWKFEQAVCRAARESGVDGVICGHLHRPEVLDLGDVLYCNDGDWVESCTALVEDFAGQLSLLRWDGEEASVVVTERQIRVESAA